MKEDIEDNLRKEDSFKTLLDILKMEYEELTRCIQQYSTKIFRLLTGTLTTAILIFWYDLQKPGNTNLLSFLASIVIHPAAIYGIYCYIVYRTLKITKAIQAARINALTGSDSALIWESIWNKIWSNKREGITHSLLGRLFIVLFFFVFIAIVILTSKRGASYLSSGYERLFYCAQAILVILEIVISFYYMWKIPKYLKTIQDKSL